MGVVLAHLPEIGGGLLVTLELTVLAFAGALVLGTIVAVFRISPLPPLRALGLAYVEVFRNIPLLMLLVLIAFGLPEAGLKLSLFASATVGMGMYAAAYVCEAIRSGVQTIGAGQVEAARAIGLTFGQVLRHVVLPQAFRSMAQPLGNIFIAVALGTSLSASIGLMDLTGVTRLLNVAYAEPIATFAAAAVCYVLITLSGGLLTGAVERRARILR
ncbi:MAG TPA: amino acid ABC transporter permease [Streptosporangiaceae bacterium]|jgi:glutamate transport system permease protein